MSVAFFVVTGVLLAADWTPPTQDPPYENAPGYIFNSPPSQQAGGSFNISGNGMMGLLTVTGGDQSATVNSKYICLADGANCTGVGYWTQTGSGLYPTNTIWNVGIGLNNPLSKLQIANNLGSGNIDQYSEYQLLLYNGGTPAGSYGLGMQASTLVFNSTANYKFFRNGVAADLSLIGGNAGIRETAPGYPVHVDDNDSTGIINIDNDGANLWSGVRLERGADTERWFIGMGDAASGFDDRLLLRRTRSGAATNDIVIGYTTGYVGIGTAAPTERLDVAGSMSLIDEIIHTGDTDTNIKFREDNVTVRAGIGALLDVADTVLEDPLVRVGTTNPADPIDFSVGPNKFFVEGTTGFVGIVTALPVERLDD